MLGIVNVAVGDSLFVMFAFVMPLVASHEARAYPGGLLDVRVTTAPVVTFTTAGTTCVAVPGVTPGVLTVAVDPAMPFVVSVTVRLATSKIAWTITGPAGIVNDAF